LSAGPAAAGSRSGSGPEYEETVRGTGNRRHAEKDLTARADRHDQLDIQPLDPALHAEFSQRWRRAQELFVDEPSHAVQSAHYRALFSDLLHDDTGTSNGHAPSDVSQRRQPR
jgi:hypothetical protein